MTVAPPIHQPTDSTRMVVTAELPFLTPDDAFAHFVSPDLITMWWPEQAEIDRRQGGRFRLMWPHMNWELFGDFLAFEEPGHLRFTWAWIHQPQLPTRTVDVRIEPWDTGSFVTVTQGEYGSSDVEQDDRQGHIDGWTHFLGRLQTLSPID